MEKKQMKVKDLDKYAPTKSDLKRMYPKYPVSMVMTAANDILTNYGENPKKKFMKQLTCPQFKELREFLGDPTKDSLGNDFL